MPVWHKLDFLWHSARPSIPRSNHEKSEEEAVQATISTIATEEVRMVDTRIARFQTAGHPTCALADASNTKKTRGHVLPLVLLLSKVSGQVDIQNSLCSSYLCMS